jgi:hypothetical protein
MISSSAQAGHRNTAVPKREDPGFDPYEELTGMEHAFLSAQGSAYMRFRRALDRGNVTEALSAASELQFVSLAEALELTLLLVGSEPDKFSRAVVRCTPASSTR